MAKARKHCAQCSGKLGLGVRFTNLFTRYGWLHLRFCSNLCRENFELEKANANKQVRWLAYLGSGK